MNFPIKKIVFSSVKLKFQSFHPYPEKKNFFINCTTFDGLNVVCRGSIDLDHANLANLQKNDEIQLRNVLVKFLKERPNHVRNDLILIQKSDVFRDSFGIKLRILTPKKSFEKLPKQDFKTVPNQVGTSLAENFLLGMTSTVFHGPNSKMLPYKVKNEPSHQVQPFKPKLQQNKNDNFKKIIDCPIFAKW